MKYLRTNDGQVFSPRNSRLVIVYYEDTAVEDADVAAIVAEAADQGVTITVSDTPTPTGGGDGEAPSGYDAVLTEHRCTLLYVDGVGWAHPLDLTAAVTTRPTDRPDVFFDLVGGTQAVPNPEWMIWGDKRTVVGSP